MEINKFILEDLIVTIREILTIFHNSLKRNPRRDAVVCDSTNNTSEVIDRNEFVGDIFIKPARSINFIQLNFIAVSTGVDFSEVVGKF